MPKYEKKAIKGFPGYSVDTEGNVYGKRFDVILRPGLYTNRYYGVTLFKGGVRCYFTVHRLVAEAFIPNPLNKLTVNHKNGIKIDNRIDNLEWATWSENNKHAFDVLHRKPSGTPPVQLIAMHKETGTLHDCESYTVAAGIVGCDKRTIWAAVNRTSIFGISECRDWKYIVWRDLYAA